MKTVPLGFALLHRPFAPKDPRRIQGFTMTRMVLLMAVLVAVLLSPRHLNSALAHDPVAVLEFADQDQPKKQPEKDKKAQEKKAPTPPPEDVFARAPAPISEALGFNPHMMGDFGVYFANQNITLVGTQTTKRTTILFIFDPETRQKIILSTNTVTTTTTVTQTRTILVPIAAAAGAFKIAENESPRPVDRVFGTWNYYGGIQGPTPASSSPVNTFQSTTFFNSGLGTTVDTAVNTSFPNAPRVSANLNRELFGFEKTFLDGYASIELRMPLNQLATNFAGFGGANAADLTIIGKYAVLLDPTSGDVFSIGMAVTAPTGSGVNTVDGTFHSTLVQPWFGYIWNADRFFIQAFHSLVVPTDSRDVTLLFNDIGFNYWLYRGPRNAALNFIVPTAEVHVTTPLDHRSADAALFVPDTVVLTGGVHFGLFRNSTLSLGVATAVTGPRLFNVESFLQFNWRF
jgi:hypothetical protein